MESNKFNKILIGSSAIKHWYSDFNRDPKDIDYAIDDKHTNLNSVGIEYLYNPIIFKYTNDNILDPDLLLTLKASHICWDINWEKHMWDIQFLLKKGCKINIDVFWDLYNFWNIHHSINKRSDLNMTKEEFFTNKINYNVCEHDILHTLVNPNPIYLKILQSGKEVELDENKFESLSYNEKISFIKEEVMVMSFERYKDYFFKSAYSKMLKKFIVNHAPLFSLIFTIENYIKLLQINTNYFKTIEDGLHKIKQII